jgi:hypothetical protein
MSCWAQTPQYGILPKGRYQARQDRPSDCISFSVSHVRVWQQDWIVAVHHSAADCDTPVCINGIGLRFLPTTTSMMCVQDRGMTKMPATQDRSLSSRQLSPRSSAAFSRRPSIRAGSWTRRTARHGYTPRPIHTSKSRRASVPNCEFRSNVGSSRDCLRGFRWAPAP